MTETFLFAFNAIVPMLLLMLLGCWLKWSRFFDAQVLKTMNAFTFRFGISAMVFRSVYTLPALSDIRLDMMGFVLVSCGVLTALGWLSAMAATKQRNRRGVIIQNSFRSNFAVIGIVLATSLGSVEGGAMAASMQVPTIIYYNIMAVLCLTAYSDRPDRAVDIWGILKRLAVNPMILGQVGGVICLLLREIIPRGADGTLAFSLAGNLPFVYSAVDSLASMATPLILVLLGAQVDFRAVGEMKKELAAGVVQRLVIAPVAGFGMALLAQRLGVLALTPAAVSALLGLYGSPVAVASAVMAEELGGDAELARQYVVWTAALSMATLFLWILLFRTLHML